MAPTSNTLDVLVVGAGPTGLTLACELLRHGLSCRIIDHASAPSEHSKALALHARTLEGLDLLGLAEELVDKGIKIQGLNMYTKGKRLLHLNLEKLDTRFPFVLSIPQSETERSLAQRLSQLGGSVERAFALTHATQNQEGITATLSQMNGQSEEIRARWLVGCDGAHSTVRNILGLSFKGSRYEEAFLLADLQLNWEWSDEESHVFLTRSGVVAAIPIPGGQHRLIVDLPHELEEQEQAEVALEELQAILDGRGVTGFIKEPTWIAKFRIHRRIVPQFRVGRVFLAGDAAHIHSPVGGQGMNLGMQDAMNLAWKLVLVTGRVGRPKLLKSYQAERHPIAAATLTGTDIGTRIFTLRNPFAQGIRNTLMSWVSSWDVIQHRLARTVAGLEVNYRRSPIVLETGGSFLSRMSSSFGWPHTNRRSSGHTVAGDHAPDGSISIDKHNAIHRLYGLLKLNRYVLLLFGRESEVHADPQNPVEIVTSIQDRYKETISVHIVVPKHTSSEVLEVLRGMGSVVIDSEGHLAQRYAGRSMYLIRPDGYVAFRARLDQQELLLDYLNMIFL